MKARYPQEWIDDLKSKVSLLDIARENLDLRKTGNRFTALCPFHSERSPSFSIGDKFYHCFGCKKGGDAISFLMELHGLSFDEAIEDLAERASVELPKGTAVSDQDAANRAEMRTLARLNLFAAHFYQHQLTLPHSKESREYLKKRGISEETQKTFSVGTSSLGYEGLTNHLIKSKAPLPLAEKLGLIRKSQKNDGFYDLFRDRIVFPLIDPRKRVCGFGGRIYPWVDESGRSQGPKYLNSPETPLFQKSRFLYGVPQAKPFIHEKKSVIVVEGYFDVIGLHQAGIKNVVATCGTALTDEHLKQLQRIAPEIIVFFDNDNAGITATRSAMELGLKSGVTIKTVHFESKLDPDEFVMQGEEQTKQLMEWISKAEPIIDREIRTLMTESTNPDDRTKAVKQILTWFKSFQDPVGRSLRIQEWVKTYSIPAELVKEFGVSTTSMQSRPAQQQSSPQRPQYSPQQGQQASGQTFPPQSRAQQPRTLALGQGAGKRPATRVISKLDRQTLRLFCHWQDFAAQFYEMKQLLPEKDTIAACFADTEIQSFVLNLLLDPVGLQKWAQAPESCLKSDLSEELRSLILESLLDQIPPDEKNNAKQVLSKAAKQSWARFSHALKEKVVMAEKADDREKHAEYLQQYLDLQRKLKEFE